MNKSKWIFYECDEHGKIYKCPACDSLIHIDYHLNDNKPDKCTNCCTKLE